MTAASRPVVGEQRPTIPVPAQRSTGARLLGGRSVALVHEWYGVGGAENTFLAMTDLLPHAERFVLWAEPGIDPAALRMHESWLARTPLRRWKPLALPVMPLTWRTLSRARFDVVLSSSHAFAHTVKFGGADHTRYLSYVHSPARYVWSPAQDSRGAGRMLALPRRALRAADVRLSRHVHAYAANSLEVQARIRRFWHRDAVVIHPPVDIDFFTAAPAAVRSQPRDYLLGVGRWIPYKNFELMVDIAAEAGLPLVLAGWGPLESQLRQAAARSRVPVRFEVHPSQERLRELYWGARALLFPTHDDFGIVPVEAQACGTPVIGLRRGGVVETVVDGATGVLVDSIEPTAFAAAVRRLPDQSGAVLQRQAARFSTARFATELAAWVADASA